MMRLPRPAAHVLIAMAFLVSAAARAGAQEATFSDVRDAVAGKFFDSASTQPNPLNPNQLLIGFNTGFDFATFTFNDFRASTLPFSNRSAADTISFVVTAPSGYYVSAIRYTQQGTASPFRTSVQTGTTFLVLAGFPARVGVFSNPNLTGGFDLTQLKLQSVPVSLTISLFAAGTGSIAVTNADVTVELAPLPCTESCEGPAS
jgi:hypothetical protein